MALLITITNAGRAEIINAQNTGTEKVTITAVAFGTEQYTPSKTQTALQNEVKRVTTIAGQAVAADTIHVVAMDESSAAYNVGEFGLISDKGTLIAVYSQLPAAGWIIQKAAPSTLLLATDIILESLDASVIEFGDISFINPPATVDTPGVVQLEHSLTNPSNARALTAGMGKKLQDEKEPNIAAGTTAQYWRGNKSWRDFATDVRASVLTGLSTVTNAAVAATDSVLVALGKLQAQVSSKLDATANAVSATKLQTARTIGGVPFDGTANINLPGVNAAGNQNTTGNAATATKLATARALTIGDTSKSFDGSAPLSWTLSEIGAAAAAHGHAIADVEGLQAAINAASGLNQGANTQDPDAATTPNLISNHANTPNSVFFWHISTSFYGNFSATGNRAQLAIQYAGGTEVYARSCYNQQWRPWVRLDQDVTKEPLIEPGTTAQYWRGNKGWRDFATDVRASLLTGLSTATNAAIAATDSVLVALGKLQAQVTSKLDATANAVSATKLQTARTINGVAFDGTANITVEDSTKEPSIAAGTIAQYWRGNKGWRDFATDVRASVLTGLSTASNTAISATDSVLVALGKLQAQFNNLPFTASYTSTQQSIVLGGTLTLAHGLPRAPQLLEARLVCVIAQYGYAVGEEVAANPGISSVNASSGWALIPTATEIEVKIGSAATVVIRKDTGGALAITPANWKLVVRAWA